MTKTSISSKLFLGFLLVIFLNVLFVVVVSRFSQLYGITRMIGWQNEIKNKLLRISTLHKTQRTNFIIFEKLGRQQSYEYFIETSSEVDRYIDSLQGYLHAIENVDTTITESSCTWRIRKADDRLRHLLEDRLPRTTATYAGGVSTFAGLALSDREADRMLADSFTAPVRAAADTLLHLLGRSERIVDELTRLRLADVKSRIEDARFTSAAILAFTSIFALVFAYIFSRKITDALRRLKESATRIGRCEFQFDLNGYPDDEIGELAHAFERMARNLRDAQDELVRSKRLAAIGQVVTSINHEINNPLMIISGNAQLLEMSLSDRPEDVRRLRSIIEETERITRVTRRLRDLRNPVVEEYTPGGDEMINLEKSQEPRSDVQAND